MTDYEALDKALRDKASSPMECPVCRENRWGTPNARFGFWPLDPPIDVRLEGDADEVDEAAGFWPITCQNCGYVRLFHVETLLSH
jgi:hypothetical protein